MPGHSKRAFWRKFAAVLGAVTLSLLAAAGTAGVASAETPSNRTPDSALTITSLPYQGAGQNWVDGAPAATDAAARMVSTGCNSGNALYGTAWWKYTATSSTTFVSHASMWVGNVGGDEPIGLAVVSGDLTRVLSCGTEGTSISDAGATTLSAGETVYFVAYQKTPLDPTILEPNLGVYPSTGVVPPNDSFGAPAVISSLPFTSTVDTTLATREPTEPACYSKFGVGPSVWYSVTVAKTQRLIVGVTGDFDVQYVIAPPQIGDGAAYICDSQFEAQAGVTYRIGLYGTDELRNSGRATITVSAVPAAPTAKIVIDSTGLVKKKTGVVQLSGTVRCTAGATAQAVSGTITQTYKRVIHQQAFSGTTPACTGKAATWTARIVPTTFLWTTGDASVTASVTACNVGGCGTGSAKTTVRLKAA